MNLFLIWTTAFVRRKDFTPFRWFLVSTVFAIFSVIHKIHVLKAHNSGGENIVCKAVYCIVCIFFMTAFAYKYKNCSKNRIVGIFLEDVITLFFCAIVTAGGLLFVRSHLNTDKKPDTVKAFILMIVSIAILYVLFFMMRNIIRNEAKKCETIVRATLIQGEVKININVLYDTGNSLFSPYTNEPVNIISKETAMHTGIADVQKPLLIPYKTISGSGLLETFRFEKLVFENGEVMVNFLGALSEKTDGNSDVSMILNCHNKKTKKRICKKEDKNGKDFDTKQISF